MIIFVGFLFTFALHLPAMPQHSVPPLLFYAIPWFITLIIAEIIFSVYQHKDLYEKKDAASSIALGLGNLGIGIVTKIAILACYNFVYTYRLFNLGFEWWVWVLAFFAEDLTYYIFHRASHHINWFWASHVVHHSSQYYNLAAALRQTWTGNFTGSFIFWMWMPLAGFHPVMIMTLQACSLIYQFWIHTEAIHRLPLPVEYIMNTPSHHRVHHGSDLKYLDKNHGGVLIIWDRLFGSFQQEEERPVYGLTKNIGSFNPVIVAFKTWGELIKKAVSTGSVITGLKYFTHPPGWSHDGTSKTTRELRMELGRKEEKSSSGTS